MTRRTVKRCKAPTREPGRVIRANILTHVTEGQRRGIEIAEAFNYSRPTVVKYANQLCDDGLIHFVVTHGAKGGHEYIYRLGPAPEKLDDEPEEVVRQATFKSYAPLRIVDPWMLPRAFFQGAQA
jgi:hypothetical protein